MGDHFHKPKLTRTPMDMFLSMNTSLLARGWSIVGLDKTITAGSRFQP